MWEWEAKDEESGSEGWGGEEGGISLFNIQAVIFNRPTLAIFSAGLGEPILFKISGLVYVLLICVLKIRGLALKLTILYYWNFPLFYKHFSTVHKKY